MSIKKEKNGATSPTVEYQFPSKERETFAEMIYNSKEGTVLGRNLNQWGKLMLFYAIFYAILAVLFTICMQGLFLSLPVARPKWILERSLIGTNPGLGYRPVANETLLGSVVQYNTKKPDTIKYWTQLIDDYLAPYHNQKLLTNGGTNQKICDFDTKIGSDEVCAITLENFGPCTQNASYGYDRSKPCFFLKLNKIIDWVPEFYNNVTDLPEDMPSDLQSYIKSIQPKERNQIWISCKGQHASDAEIIGDIQYYPSRGLPSYYYPYRNVPGYLNPLIAIQLVRPKMNQLIHIECRAWAKNIQYNGSLRDRQGSVLFELLID